MRPATYNIPSSASQPYRIENVTRRTELATHAEMADHWFSRAKGLLGRAALAPGEGLIITRCRSVHMVGMRFAIDAVFVGGDGRVVRLCPSLRPWSFSPIAWHGSLVVELREGVIHDSRTQVGDVITIDRAAC